MEVSITINDKSQVSRYLRYEGYNHDLIYTDSFHQLGPDCLIAELKMDGLSHMTHWFIDFIRKEFDCEVHAKE